MAKRHLEAIETRGYRDVDGAVCSACISEPALIDAIRAEGTSARCDYCQQLPIAPDATVLLERVVQLITEGFRFEYEDPANGAGWDGREGGYQVLTMHTFDLLWEHEITEDRHLFEDIVGAIILELWCQKDPYAASDAEALQWGWEAFRKYVKHRRRYTFLTRDDSTADGAGSIPMHGVPAAVVNAVAEAGLTTVFPAGETWWRARPHDPGEKYMSAIEIGSPPDQGARDNRMSPKGIGVFYGTSTAKGARDEVAGYAKPDQEATIGRFTQLTELTVVDLRDLPAVPSLFDAPRRHLRAPLIFLRDFIRDVTKVADPSDTQNLEYIPTQVIAEHLRYDLPADGIVWRSTKDRNVTVSVLFVSNTAMADAGAADVHSQLELDPATVELLPAPL